MIFHYNCSICFLLYRREESKRATVNLVDSFNLVSSLETWSPSICLLQLNPKSYTTQCHYQQASTSRLDYTSSLFLVDELLLQPPSPPRWGLGWQRRLSHRGIRGRSCRSFAAMNPATGRGAILSLFLMACLSISSLCLSYGYAHAS